MNCFSGCRRARRKVSGAPNATPPAPAQSLNETAAAALDSRPVTHNGNAHPGPCITVVQSEPVRPAAYDEALSQVDEKIRLVVRQGRDLKELFDSLDETNNKQKNESIFRRGAEKIQSPIKFVDSAIKGSLPFVGFDPTASAALSIFQGVTTLAVGVLGLEDRLDNYIKDMLSQIKVVDECDELCQQFDDSELIHKALVEVYKNLLLFYYTVVHVLTQKSVAWAWTSEEFNKRIPPVVHSFLKHANLLRQHIDNANIKSIQTQLIDTKIGQILGSNKLDEKFYFECTSQTANDACKWAIADPVFCAWYGTTATHPLVLHGEMGTGKTITITFMIDHVTRLNQGQFPRALICYHYCRDDETGKSAYVYSSLLQQLMEKQKSIKDKFCRWTEELKSERNYSPTHDSKLLGDFFFDSIKSLERPIFIFLDGLDECDDESCEELVTSLKHQSPTIDGLKCCISARYHPPIQALLESSPGIKMPKDDAERDKIIVTHMVEKRLSFLKGAARTLVIEKLSEGAQGSAIWVRMAVNLLKLRNIRPVAKLEAFLRDELLGSELSDLYAKLFSQITKHDDDNSQVLSDALEILATVERPLSISELGWVVALRGSKESLETVQELEGYVEEERVLSFLSPFISSYDAEATNSRQVRLAHQSIRELVFRSPPRHWAQFRGSTPLSNAILLERRSQLHGRFARECVKYLLLAEIGDQNLYSDEQEDAIIVFGLPRGFDDGPSDANSSADGETSTTADTHKQSFDPAERGFGGFFTYASCYWLDHSRKADRENGPSLSDVISLTDPKTVRSKNWWEQFHHPDCTREGNEGHMEHSDTDLLTVVSLYGPAHLFEELLRDVKEGRLSATTESRERAVQAILWREDDISRLPKLICFDTYEKAEEGIFLSINVIRHWSCTRKRVTADEEDEFDALFDHIASGFGMVVDKEWGNEILCIAASCGCLPFIERLFKVASCNPSLKQDMLRAPHRGDGKSSGIGTHQSVGEAAWLGHGAVVAFLLKQEGIEAHLRYRGLNGYNVFHHAVDRMDLDTVNLLLSRYPEGIHETYDDMGSTALQGLISGSGTRGTNVEIVKTLLGAGADVRCGLDQQPSDWHEPIRMASRYGDVNLIKTLVRVGGADPMSVFKPSQDQDGELEFIDTFENERKMEVKETLLCLHREKET